MAYARKRRYTRRPSGSSRGRKTTRPSARRYRSTGRTRRYTRKRPMSKKSILNVTSEKKRDTMLAWTNTGTTGASITPKQDATYISAATGAFYIWCATSRDLLVGGQLAPKANESARTATTCYMRGLSEKLRIQSSSGLPWFHRRICFTAKGPTPYRLQYTGDSGAAAVELENSNGYVRFWQNQAVNNTTNYQNEVFALIFKGAQGVDWSDLITAPVDQRRITVKFDKTWTYRSGNANGMVKETKLWHAMNHNLVYNDDEAGTAEGTSAFSTTSKAGMGDYYVIDIIGGGAGGTASDILRIDSTSSLYWHEK
uniref:Capsid protein n=1 Tax=Myotis emarginatus feces associated gemycircularvirus 2 TaxID=3139992 RepID=A0AAU6S592_9VIRU